MSTSPFIQVEGSIALPRMRPLGPVAVSFGREWMLTPPHFCLRAEIRAFYAAIMRTVCLSAEAFREVCRWDLQHPPSTERAAAPVRPRATAKASQPPSKDKTLPHIDAARFTKSWHTPSSGASRLAGGACVIGGAALLAWIVASQMPHNERDTATAADTAPIRDARGGAAQRLADERAAHERTTTTATSSTTGTVTSASHTSQPAETPRHEASVATSAAVSSPAPRPSAPSPDYAAANLPTAPLRATLSDRANKPSESARGRASRERVAGVPRVESSRHSAQSFAPHRIAPPVTTQRTRGMYAEASSYSPRQPSVRQDDDYASFTTYAATHTAPRPASVASEPVDGTDWVNHVSQRRVTEIPDRFAK
jgi:hypothetical protein